MSYKKLKGTARIKQASIFLQAPRSKSAYKRHFLNKGKCLRIGSKIREICHVQFIFI